MFGLHIFLMIDYYSLQIGLSILFAAIGAAAYTVVRYEWKKTSITNLNDFMKSLDIGAIIQQIEFDPKFAKTCLAAFIISIGVVLLSYADVVQTIVPNEAITITVAKAMVLGAGLNFGINTAVGGGQLSGLLQALIIALAKPNTNDTQAQSVQRLMSAKGYKVILTDNTNQKQEQPKSVVNPNPT